MLSGHHSGLLCENDFVCVCVGIDVARLFPPPTHVKHMYRPPAVTSVSAANISQKASVGDGVEKMLC